MQQRPSQTTASHPATDAERLAVPPDTAPAPAAAAWLRDPAAPPAESPNARLIRQWTTEPQAPPPVDQPDELTP